MATTLQSPGVSVSVIDESFYTPAAPGTVPMIFVATAQDKQNASKTGTAQGTTKANAGKVWTITSQRDLTDTFGTPKFYTDANQNPIHGNELNEYGLQAAYSLLGVSSKAYVVRADIDLTQLEAKSSIPKGDPISGTYWLDTANTLFGINEWDATNAVFVSKTPLVIDDASTSTSQSGLVPNQSFGTVGSYAIVATSDNQAPLYYKNNNNNWVLVGSNEESSFGHSISSSTFLSNSWATSFPIIKGTKAAISGGSSGTLIINDRSITLSGTTAAAYALSINSQMPQVGVGAKLNPTTGYLELYADASSTGTHRGIVISGTSVDYLGLNTGTYEALALTIAPHTQIPQYGTDGYPTGSVYIKTTSASKGANWVVKYYNGSTKSWGTISAPIYATSEAAIKGLDIAGGKNIAVGSLYIESNYDHGTGSYTYSPKQANFKIYRRTAVSPTTITGNEDLRSYTYSSTLTSVITIAETVAGSSSVVSQTITIVHNDNVDNIVSKISGAGLTNVSASVDDDGNLSIKHALGGDIQLTDDFERPVLTALGFTPYNMVTKQGTANLYNSGDYDSYDYRASNWKPLVFEAKAATPSTDPADGTLWYGSNLTDVDILYHNGTTWVGYRDATAFPNSDVNGPQLAASAPKKQSDKVSDLVNGDIWIDTANSDEYGQNIYVYNGTTLKWVKQDVTDQEGPNGWLFHDARWAVNGYTATPSTIKALLTENFLDPDAPDPALYPQGMRLWNLRRSGFNIKKYVIDAIDITANDGTNVRYDDEYMDGSQGDPEYLTARWVTVSPNADDGSGTFGRKAQRGFVVKSLKSLIDTNQEVRDTDTVIYNLLATPGYPELIQNMCALNADRAYTGFVIGDTPFRLKANATDLAAWGSNTSQATDNGDVGAVTNDEYMAMFYPSGYTTDNSGNKIMVPASHMMLRTITVSDQKSYQWFAPAGIRRGGVDNATSVGYLEDGEFKTAALPNSIRDTMIQTARVNPIATLNGVGIVNFGNLTRARGASSLDRINVSRLVAYLRRQLDILARPFLFEPNDRNTRNEIRNTAESLLLELVGQRALYDYIVVCDESNNTSARIDRSELWMDIAIEPVKAVEFIYIPLRLKKTGSIKAGT
jgi:hypothetical protein